MSQRLIRLLETYNFSAFLLLLLFYFAYSFLEIPAWFVPVGRMHLMVLHLPIGLWVASIILSFTTDSKSTLPGLMWKTTAASAMTAAIMGLMLSTEGGYDESTLAWHRHLSVSFAALSYLLCFVSKKTPYFLRAALVVLGTGLLFAGGHFGAEITHGKDFIFPKEEKQTKFVQVNDESKVYESLVFPILSSKCVTCHKPSKSKGDLIMTDTLSLLKGGESGKVIDQTDPEKSYLLEVIHFPEDDEKHMPPSGKNQLTEEEKAVIQNWILEGCSFSITLGDLTVDHPLRIVAEKHNQEIVQDRVYNFEAADNSVLLEINSDFVTVNPIAANSPALKANFYVASEFRSESLNQLLKVKDQLVYLNFNYMQLEEVDWKVLPKFKNLEELYLNYSSITDDELSLIFSLPGLRRLSLTGTQITNNIEKYLATKDTLEEIFLSDTQISFEAIESWKKRFKTLKINFETPSEELVQLTSPTLVNEKQMYNKGDSIVLESKIKGAIIKYTLDKHTVDSLTGKEYEKPIKIDKTIVLKTIAVKEGWLKSPQTRTTIYVKGTSADSTILHFPPHKDYPGRGSITLSDELKGEIDALKEGAWLGFKDREMKADFFFNEPKNIKYLLLSYGIQVPAYVFPPTIVKVYAGNSPDDLVLVHSEKIPLIEESDKNKVENNYLEMAVNLDAVKIVRIEAMNLPKIPKWHNGKGETGWLFVDEVIFN